MMKKRSVISSFINHQNGTEKNQHTSASDSKKNIRLLLFIISNYTIHLHDAMSELYGRSDRAPQQVPMVFHIFSVLICLLRKFLILYLVYVRDEKLLINKKKWQRFFFATDHYGPFVTAHIFRFACCIPFGCANLLQISAQLCMVMKMLRL